MRIASFVEDSCVFAYLNARFSIEIQEILIFSIKILLVQQINLSEFLVFKSIKTCPAY